MVDPLLRIANSIDHANASLSKELSKLRTSIEKANRHLANIEEHCNQITKKEGEDGGTIDTGEDM